MSDRLGDGPDDRLGDGPDDRPPPGPAAEPQPIETGTVGMIFFIVSLSMLFAASIAVYLLMRHMHQPWPPPDFPALPSSLWLSTFDIVFTSVTIQGAVAAARRNDQIALRRNLLVTLALGLAFLGLQSYAWWTIWKQVADFAVAGKASNSYLTMFYAVTGLHAVHVVGGLVPLVMVTRAAYQGIYGPKKTAAVRYTAIYWHFLDVVWCILFTVVYLL